ncbi:MAG: hypothetical protein WBJ10_00925, partial [Daejeonella sp.]|uniref:tetratricopeptide repeat protein n=1 Tax=Daejeonella sp. TaxID=2805397 RepID=UPI003C741679
MKKILVLLIVILSASPLMAQLSPDEALAVQYFQTGEFDKAAVIYEKLFNRTKNPGYYDPLFTSWIKTTRYDEAEELARKLLKAQAGNYTYAVDIGRIHQERGEQE